MVNKATAGKPSAVVWTRPNAEKYLLPYEFGGAHVLPQSALLVPKNVRLNQYGQMPYHALANLKAQPDVFVGTINGVYGLWKRGPALPHAKGTPRPANARSGKPQHTGLKLLVRFSKDELPVTKHLDFNTRARAIVSARAVAVFRDALDRALRTAK